MGASQDELQASRGAGSGSTDLVPSGSGCSFGNETVVFPEEARFCALGRPAPQGFSPRSDSWVLPLGPPLPAPGPDLGRLTPSCCTCSPATVSKSSVRLGRHKSWTHVFCHLMPSSAGQGNRATYRHSKSSGADAYRCATLMLCHLPHHKRCRQGNPSLLFSRSAISPHTFLTLARARPYPFQGRLLDPLLALHPVRFGVTTRPMPERRAQHDV